MKMQSPVIVALLIPVALLIGVSGCEQSSQLDEVEPAFEAYATKPLLVSGAGFEAAVPPGATATVALSQLDVVYPDEIFLPWGDAIGEIGLLPPAEERMPQGPLSLAVDIDGSFWVLDQVNARLAHLSPEGAWLGSLSAPPGATDLSVGPDGRLFVLSLINHRVTVLDREGNREHVGVPMALRLVAGILVDSRGHLLLTTAYENTYDLGAPDLWIPWPDLLHTVSEGLPGVSGGRRFRPALHDGQAALLSRVSRERPFDTWTLPETEGVASVALLDSEPDGSVVVLLEWLDDDGVERVVRRVDQQRGTLDEIVLAHSPFTFPFRDLAVGPDGGLHRLYTQPDGLRIVSYSLGRNR